MNTNQNKLLKVAVVGGGAFGEVHLRTFAGMPQVEVGGIYTLERERGDELCARYGGKNYESLETLATDPTIDLVSIATPENHHMEPFRMLAANKKAIYVEKPLATSLEEAKEILDLSATITAMSGHCLRFEQRVAATQARLQGVRKHHLSFRDRRTRTEKETYGRVHPAYCMLCHEIELSNAFAQSQFRRVIALETHYSSGQVDGMTIMIEYENGITSSVEGGWYLPAQTACDGNDFISIVSDAGVDEMNIPHLGYYRFTKDGIELPNQYYGHDIFGIEYGPLRAAFDYMVRCIVNNETPQISTIRDAYDAVELITGAIQSVELARWVERHEVTPRRK